MFKKMMAWGAGPRASLNLILAGKARAALRGRSHVSIDDVKALSLPVLRHRIVPSFAARSEGMTADTLIEKLLEDECGSCHLKGGDELVVLATPWTRHPLVEQ